MKHPNRLVLFLLAAAILGAGRCAGTSATNPLRGGVWAAERGLWDEAVLKWEAARDAGGASAALHNNLAIAYEKKGLWDKARSEYEAALKLDPDNASIKGNYRKFLDNQAALAREREAGTEKRGHALP
jgi:tetratricopeptide (TPR) repeat protein